jgi:hypothetical protein
LVGTLPAAIAFVVSVDAKLDLIQHLDFPSQDVMFSLSTLQRLLPLVLTKASLMYDQREANR